MTYAALTEGATGDARADLDYAIHADPGAPPTRQKGANELMRMLANPPGRR